MQSPHISICVPLNMETLPLLLYSMKASNSCDCAKMLESIQKIEKQLVQEQRSQVGDTFEAQNKELAVSEKSIGSESENGKQEEELNFIIGRNSQEINQSEQQIDSTRMNSSNVDNLVKTQFAYIEEDLAQSRIFKKPSDSYQRMIQNRNQLQNRVLKEIENKAQQKIQNTKKKKSKTSITTPTKKVPLKKKRLEMMEKHDSELSKYSYDKYEEANFKRLKIETFVDEQESGSEIEIDNEYLESGQEVKQASRKAKKCFSPSFLYPHDSINFRPENLLDESSLGIYDRPSSDQVSFEKISSSASTVISCFCNGEITENKNSICCDFCHKWYHRKCSGLLVRQVQFFEENQDFQWFCEKCLENESDQKLRQNRKRSDPEKMQDVLYEIQHEVGAFKKMVERQVFEKLDQQTGEHTHFEKPEALSRNLITVAQNSRYRKVNTRNS